MLYKEYIKGKKSEDTFKEASSLIHDELSAYDTYVDVYNKNSDFVGWIYIEDTNINYPVMQTINEPNYYLRRGFDKAYNPYGVPYIQEDCDVLLSNNLIIYGHNADNGSMFSDLCKYSSEEYYLSHKFINFDTLSEFGKYEIFAVFKVDISADDLFEYYKFVDSDKEEFDTYVNKCKELSFYDTDVDVSYGDKLITLVTCEHYYESDGRIIVVAKKI